MKEFGSPEHPKSIEQDEGIETTKERFRIGLEALTNQLPEVARNREAIARAGEEIIETIGMKHWFTSAGTVNELWFTSIAAHQAALDKADGLTEEEYIKGSQFTLDAARLFAHGKLERDEGREEIIDLEQSYETHKRFTHLEATEELKEAIEKRGLLDNLREHMGITPETEVPFEVMVLDIEEPLAEHPERLAQTKQFCQEVGRTRTAAGWRVYFEEIPHIVLTLDTADLVLARSQKLRSGTLHHEYVHTQDPQLSDGYVGLGFEEMRAELMRVQATGASWKTVSYPDYLNAYVHLDVITEVDVLTLIEEATFQKDADLLYLGLAEKLGLKGMLEMSLALDAHYSKGIDSTEQRIADYIGKPDDIVWRFYEAEVQDPTKKHHLEERLGQILQDNQFKRGIPLPRLWRRPPLSSGTPENPDKSKPALPPWRSSRAKRSGSTIKLLLEKYANEGKI